MMHSAEGFLLLSLPQATLTATAATYTGCLYLECVTIVSSDFPFPDRDVYLVLRISDLEIAIDPSRNISSSALQNTRIYTFHATDTEPRFEVAVPLPHENYLAEDLETFDQILTQYARFHPEQTNGKFAVQGADLKTDKQVGGDNEYEDLRGRLVLINESDGQVVGELDSQFNILEDPSLTYGLGENEPVILELPPDYETAVGAHGQRQQGGSTSVEAFVYAVPPGERDLLTSTARLVSHAISATTTLLLSGVSYASNYYVKNSEPSSKNLASMSSSNLSARPPYGNNHSSSSSQPPPHGAVIISNPKTRTALTYAHAVSGSAVKISGKTIEVIEGLTKKTVGAKEDGNRKQKRLHPLAPQPRNPRHASLHFAGEKPHLPPRKGDPEQSPYSSHLTPGFLSADRQSPLQGPPPLPERLPLRKRDRIILSTDLILSTIEESARRILDVGAHEITKVVAHKHGQEAGENTALAAGTARNVALIYIDMRGIGRRAIIRKTGKEFVKARFRNRNSSHQQDAFISIPQQGISGQYPGTSSHSVSSTSIPAYSEAPRYKGYRPASSPRPDGKKDPGRDRAL